MLDNLRVPQSVSTAYLLLAADYSGQPKILQEVPLGLFRTDEELFEYLRRLSGT